MKHIKKVKSYSVKVPKCRNGRLKAAGLSGFKGAIIIVLGQSWCTRCLQSIEYDTIVYHIWVSSWMHMSHKKWLLPRLWCDVIFFPTIAWEGCSVCAAEALWSLELSLWQKRCCPLWEMSTLVQHRLSASRSTMGAVCVGVKHSGL